MSTLDNWTLVSDKIDSCAHFYVVEDRLHEDGLYRYGGRYTRTVMNMLSGTHNRLCVVNRLSDDMKSMVYWSQKLSAYFANPYILSNLRAYRIIVPDTQWYINLYMILCAFQERVSVDRVCQQLLLVYDDDESRATLLNTLNMWNHVQDVLATLHELHALSVQFVTTSTHPAPSNAHFPSNDYMEMYYRTIHPATEHVDQEATKTTTTTRDDDTANASKDTAMRNDDPTLGSTQ